MRDLNIEFQEQYKRLDKLCKEMYSSSEGISAYIQDMENTPYLERRLVGDWDNIYKQLKRARWMRNQLAHDIPIDSDFCKQNDINWIQVFYNNILNCKDPLAIVYKAKKNALPRKTNAESLTSSICPLPKSDNASSDKTSKNINLYLFIANIVVAICCMVAIAIVWKFLPQTIPAHWSHGAIDRYGSKNEFVIHIIVLLIFWLIDLFIFFVLKLKATNCKKCELFISHGLIALFQLAYVVFLLVMYADYINF